jgi:hypothetical protein
MSPHRIPPLKGNAIMKHVALGIMAAVLFGPLSVANAQDRVRLEIVPGAVFATETLADSDLGTGSGSGVNVSVRVLPRLAPYVGWDWHRFTAETSFAGADIDVEETGYAFGVRSDQPFGRGGLALMVRVGGTYRHLELENSGGDPVGDSDHGWGWEAGAGVAVPLGDRWHVTPGVRFSSLKGDIEIRNVRTPATLRYVAVEVGFSRSF